jgi:[citrate (pro-3S)-lyase] ligase
LGTGSFRGEILCDIAVRDDCRGQGLAASIVSPLIEEQVRRGIVHFFIFTKPDMAPMFAGLGFGEIARAGSHVALLESGIGSVKQWCRQTNDLLGDLPSPRASIVMNCNPFTLGHEALIRKASEENGAVVVFAVSEDLSFFPAPDRLRLLELGVEQFKNVRVVPSGKYIISRATFPTYFLKKEDQSEAQSLLDVTLFGQKIAPELQINRRYVGEEPLDPVTGHYNDAMLSLLPSMGVEVRVIPRACSGGSVISASLVRALLEKGDFEAISALVPGHVLSFLKTFHDRPL